MSDSSVSNERIIHPAPAQAAVSQVSTTLESDSSVSNERLIQPAPAQSIVSQVSTTSHEASAEARDVNIRNLTKSLRTINNVCGPICEYMKFQRGLSPEHRVLIEINQWMLIMYGLKAMLRTEIDDNYMNITDPPRSLKQAMGEAYTNVDAVIESFSVSMKDIISMIQSRLTPVSSTSISGSSRETSILTAMTTSLEDRLPK